MAKSHFTSEVHAQNGLAVGSSEGGTVLTKILKGTVSVVIPTTAASATGDVATLSAPGAAAGDIVIVTPLTAAMEADLAIVGAWVSAADQITIRFLNNDGSNAFTGSTTNFSYMIVKS